jgi:O-acetyl-ADP-ribose deacetylase (regulator of RNase III)
MSIRIVQGDLMSAEEDILGHQVNCQGVMGSGIAKTLRDTYTNLYPSYKQFCENYNLDELLGKCQIVKTGSKYVANIFGQLNYGRQKIRYTDYDALKNSLMTLRDNATKHNLSVALPYNIGCGLANGEWNIVENIIEEVFSDYDVTLYKLQ